MAEENKEIKDKKENKEVKEEPKKTEIAEAKKTEEKSEKDKKKETGVKKNEATVNGKNLPISTKHTIAICNFIRNKNIDKAISELEDVSKLKRAVPMRGEIPHRKGMMSGRYPVNASKLIIRLLKSLKSNAMVNELELEKYKLYCTPNIASRPYKRFGHGRLKRTNVTIKLIKTEKKSLSKVKNKGDKK